MNRQSCHEIAVVIIELDPGGLDTIRMLDDDLGDVIALNEV